MSKFVKYFAIGVLSLALAYFFSFQLWLLHGRPIGKSYGFTNGFFFVEPTDKQTDKANIVLTGVYRPLIDLNIYLFGGPYPISTDWKD